MPSRTMLARMTMLLSFAISAHALVPHTPTLSVRVRSARPVHISMVSETRDSQEAPASATLAVPPLLAGRSDNAAIWRVAWPSVVIGLLRTALGQIDAWYIGRLGAAQLQAMGAASFAVWLVYIAGELSSVGVHALSSAAEGAGDRQDGVGAAVTQGLWFAVFTSLVLAATLAQPGLISKYFDLVGVKDAATAAAGTAYLRVTALGALPLSAAACASAGFKGIGETRPALAIAAATVLCNAVLNGPFIARLGVAGAAHATTLSAALGCIASLVVLRLFYGVRLRCEPPRLRALGRIGRIGAVRPRREWKLQPDARSGRELIGPSSLKPPSRAHSHTANTNSAHLAATFPRVSRSRRRVRSSPSCTCRSAARSPRSRRATSPRSASAIASRPSRTRCARATRSAQQ
eukprot:1646452-Prymnesium_polylepis.1